MSGGRLKAELGPAASAFSQRSALHPRLHADGAAVKGAIHPHTPTHSEQATHLCSNPVHIRLLITMQYLAFIRCCLRDFNRNFVTRADWEEGAL